MHMKKPAASTSLRQCLHPSSPCGFGIKQEKTRTKTTWYFLLTMLKIITVENPSLSYFETLFNVPVSMITKQITTIYNFTNYTRSSPWYAERQEEATKS